MENKQNIIDRNVDRLFDWAYDKFIAGTKTEAVLKKVFLMSFEVILVLIIFSPQIVIIGGVGYINMFLGPIGWIINIIIVIGMVIGTYNIFKGN